MMPCERMAGGPIIEHWIQQQLASNCVLLAVSREQRAYAKIIDEVNKLPLSMFQRPEEPTQTVR